MTPMLPTAEFSSCRTWRYILRRRWASGLPLGFILLNPSTADETKDDPTIRRCIGFARTWGYGGIVLGNLFAFRATKSEDMRAATDPVGPDNDEALCAISIEAHGRILCGWGNHGAFMGRGDAVIRRLHGWGAEPKALALTGAGEPGHPLYLRADLQPFALAAK